MDLDLIDIDHLDHIDHQINPGSTKLSLSESDTWGSWPNSPKLFGGLGIEHGMDEVLSKLHKPNSSSTKPNGTKQPQSPLQKKRGRKPIRPNDPIKKKTEEKDKYWLRMFRGYMKARYSEVVHLLSTEEQSFWLEHLSSKGVPDKGNVYSSYGKKYKNHLFSQPSFVSYFQEWFYKYGEIELGRKCNPGSDLWFVFFDYASKELVSYIPVGCSSMDSMDSPLSPSSPAGYAGEIGDELVDFYMVSEGNDELIEFFLH